MEIVKKIKRKLYLWHSKRPIFRIYENNNARLTIRNHNAWNYNSKFVIFMGIKYQGYGLKTYQIGLFNFALCLLISKNKIN